MKEVSLIINKHNLKLFERDEVDRSIIAEIFKLREYRRADEVIQQATHPIFDIGAHAGFFTLYCRALNSEVPIVALEPEPQNYKMLKKHCVENKIDNVEAIQGALGKTTQDGVLVVTPDSHNHYLDDKQKALPKSAVKVEVFSLGDLFKKSNYTKISLLKLDIEGGEYDVFEGLTEGDYKNIGAIIMEYHIQNKRTPKIIEHTLREHGFGVEIFPSKFDKTLGFLWAKNKRS